MFACRSSKNFNSQPHKEADIINELPAQAIKYFNSQPHKEADVRCLCVEDIVRNFNSQPHKEADLEAGRTGGDGVKFQLTASQGG